MAALRGLADLGAVDAAVVRSVSAVLDGTVAASDELRIAGAEALAKADPSARATAMRVVVHALADGDRMFASVRGGRRAGAEAILAYARAVLALAPADGRELVHAKAGSSSGRLRAELLALVS
jgi:hypothetical protein